tara:strand:+ start:6552 stop:6956 length:405 start_codon:yes stop_codon:yes gene_type:complete
MVAKAKIVELIRRYEEKEINFTTVANEIEAIAGHSVTEYEIENYWRSTSLDDFAAELAMPALEDWEDLTDGEAIALIEEALADTTGPIFARNGEALEKRYAKVTGTFSGLVFHDDISQAPEILNKLKEDSVIRL